MKDIISTREELLLAKIAGREVNINTMTPPVAADMKEKLMLEIADRIDQSGGGGGSITIDDAPTEDSEHAVSSGGVYSALEGKQAADYIVDLVDDGEGGFSAEHNGEAVSIEEIIAAIEDGNNVICHNAVEQGEIYFIGNVSFYANTDGVTSILFECNMYDAINTHTAQTYYIYGVAGEQKDEWDMVNAELLPIVSANDIGKTLKVVSDGEGGAKFALTTDASPLVITGTKSGSMYTVTADDIAAIVNAYNNHILCAIDDGTITRLYLESCSYTDAEHYQITFGVVIPVASKMKYAYVIFENSNVGTIGNMDFTPDV